MILHGIDDIRHFYQNDHRFLSQFTDPYENKSGMVEEICRFAGTCGR